MTMRIWIEAVKRPDGRNWYTDRGLLLRTRLGGPDGEVIADRASPLFQWRPRPAALAPLSSLFVLDLHRTVVVQ